MSEFSELVAKYEAQGCDCSEAYRRAKQYLYHHKRNAEQRAIRAAIEQLKTLDIAKYKELMYKVEHAGEIEAKKREEERRLREEQGRLEELKHFKFDHGLVVAGIPDIDFSGVEGMIAFRTWNVAPIVSTESGVRVGTFLGSTAMSTFWKSVMIADRVPAEDNVHGLYCVRLDPLGLMTRAASYFGDVCGLLELRGKVLEHTDGIVRAEWARIICVFIQAGEKTESIYGGLFHSYPTVPMYVLHKEQIAEILLRVTVLQSAREME